MTDALINLDQDDLQHNARCIQVLGDALRNLFDAWGLQAGDTRKSPFPRKAVELPKLLIAAQANPLPADTVGALLAAFAFYLDPENEDADLPDSYLDDFVTGSTGHQIAALGNAALVLIAYHKGYAQHRMAAAAKLNLPDAGSWVSYFHVCADRHAMVRNMMQRPEDYTLDNIVAALDVLGAMRDQAPRWKGVARYGPLHREGWRRDIPPSANDNGTVH